MCSVPIPPWVVIAISAFSGCRAVIELGWFTSGLCVSLWRSRRRTKGMGERGERRERRTESAARQSAFLRDHIGFVVFSAGSPLGAARPQTCAKESSTLWTLFTLRRGYVGANSRRRRPGTRKDPPGSNLWPGGSCCIAMLSTRSIVQTRAAPKRRGVGLRARSGVEAALRLAGRVVLYSDHINTYNRRPA